MSGQAAARRLLRLVRSLRDQSREGTDLSDWVRSYSAATGTGTGFLEQRSCNAFFLM